MPRRGWLYGIAGTLIYVLSVAFLHFRFGQPLSDFLPVLLIVGLGFSVLSWMLLRNLPFAGEKPFFPREGLLLLFLIVWIVLYITWGGDWINRALPSAWTTEKKMNEWVTLCRKLLVFVVVPMCLYRAAGFELKDFGFRKPAIRFFERRSLMLVIVLSMAILLFQYYLSNGGRAFRNGGFALRELLIGLPLCLAWLFIEAGLVEEFFFRAVLQSRLSALTRSPTGGLVLSGLVFGLCHAPGLFLRGAESEGVSEPLPFLFWCAYTIAFMSVAGLFFGMVWQRTKNIFIVMFLHAIFDLLPNAGEFIRTWMR